MADLRIDTLTSSLENLKTSQDTTDSTASNEPKQLRPPLHDGYGFRPPSGVSTPLSTSELVVDESGLGWPGVSHSHFQAVRNSHRSSQQNRPIHDSLRLQKSELLARKKSRGP